jgi:hypothetical protein
VAAVPKEKHARLVLGAPPSPRLIFHLCEHQPMELWCYGGRTVAMVTARARAPTMARVGGLAAGRGARRRAICCVAAPPEALTLRSLRSVAARQANESSDGMDSNRVKWTISQTLPYWSSCGVQCFSQARCEVVAHRPLGKVGELRENQGSG